MGWKAFTLFAFKPESLPIALDTRNDHNAAMELESKLNLGSYEYSGESDYDQGIHPNDNELYIGVYGDCYLISHANFVDAFINDSSRISEIHRLFPEHELLLIVLHSVTNYSGYIYSTGGIVHRHKVASADDGVIIDEGKPLPEEIPILERAEIIDGKKLWRSNSDDDDYYEESIMGEELVFEISKKIFGGRIDELDIWDLQLDRFVLKEESKPAKTSFWKKLFGGAK